MPVMRNTGAVALSVFVLACSALGPTTGGDGGRGLSPVDPVPELGSGTTYYVSTSGDDTNAGTSPDQAWATLTKVNATTFTPGDNLLLEGGQIFSGRIIFDASDAGNASVPVSISSYGEGRATIDAGDTTGVYIENTAGVQIFGLNVRGGWDNASQSGNDGSGIAFFMDQGGNTKLEYVLIDRVEVSGFRWSGINIAASPKDQTKSGYRDVRISNCSVHDGGDKGISSWGHWDPTSTDHAIDNLVVRRCEVHNIRGLSSSTSHTGNGIVIADVDGALIELNVAHHNGENNRVVGGPVGIWAWDSNDVVIQFNESYRNKTQTVDGGGFDLDGGCTNSVMQYNYSHDNDGPGYTLAEFTGSRPLQNNVVRYNISQNDCRKVNDCGAISFWNGSTVHDSTLVHNNVFYVSAGQGNVAGIDVVDHQPVTNMKFYNNILVASGEVPLISIGTNQSGTELIGNAYSASAFEIHFENVTYTSLADFRSATGHERHDGADTGFQGDPLLVDAGHGPTLKDAGLLATIGEYQLLPASPLVDTGIDLSSAFGIDPGPRDFYGNPLGGYPDIGVHER